jgi:uncharacterized iron-regulated membrane protein
MNIRGVILTLHLWVGMAAAVFLFLLGATGSLMVFENEIDWALNPKLTWIQPGAAPLSLAELKTKLEAANPGYTVVGFGFPPRDDMAWNASLSSNTSENGIDLAINPFTGSILGNQADRNDFMNTVHQFHLRLMAGRTGATIVTWAAVLLLLLSMSGLVLWWPRKIFTVHWRSPLKALNFDLHQMLGGRVVFVEYRKEDPEVPIKEVHKMSLEQLEKEMNAVGLVRARTVETLPLQHIVIFEKRK